MWLSLLPGFAKCVLCGREGRNSPDATGHVVMENRIRVKNMMVKHAPSPWLLTSSPLYAILPKNARWKRRAAFLPATFVARDAASRETSRTTREGTAAGNAQCVRGERVIFCLNHWWWNTNSCPHVSPIFIIFDIAKPIVRFDPFSLGVRIQQKNVCKKLESSSTKCTTCLP